MHISLQRLIVSALGFIGAISANAATVSWGTNGTTGIINQASTALPIGNWIQIGYFATLSDAQITLNAATLTGANSTATLKADFVSFSSGQVNLTQGAGGLFLGDQTNAGFANQQIFLWAMQSTNNSTLSDAIDSVVQQSIVYVPKATTPTVGAAWQFPGDPGTPITIDLDALTTVGSKILYGTFTAGANNPSLASAGFTSSNNALQLAPVPEPSTIVLGAVAALMAAGRRKRRCA